MRTRIGSVPVRPELSWRLPRTAAIAALALCGALALEAAGTALAQTPGPEPAAPAASPSAPPAPPPQGFIDAFGNWVQQGVSNMGAGFGAMVGAVGGQAGQAAKGAADAASTAAKGAADAASTMAKGAADVARETATTVKLPTGVIRGNERCELAPNGAPDCRAAAEAMCRAKGYGGGTSVDFVTNEKCPPRSRVSSREAAENGLCTLEHFVTSALCQ
jgi:hypothetical protein